MYTPHFTQQPPIDEHLGYFYFSWSQTKRVHVFLGIGKRVSLLRRIFLRAWKSLCWGLGCGCGGNGRGEDGREGFREELGLQQAMKGEPGLHIDGEKEKGVWSWERQVMWSRCQPRGNRRLVTGAGGGGLGWHGRACFLGVWRGTRTTHKGVCR